MMQPEDDGAPPRSGSTDYDPTVFTSAVRPGTRLNDIYEIEKLIGEGGMGEVYKGFNLQTGDPVAIKMIRRKFSRDADMMALFKREASTLYKLQHEAIIRYFVFSLDRGIERAYLAMEFVDGVSLAKKLEGGAMPPADVEILKTRVASGLESAHRLGVVHRDISSDNLILPDGDARQAKIIDFGIARGPQADGSTIIGTGFAGKYRYVSPEQLKSEEATFKSDIYSFGLVLAEALRGKPLDMGNSHYEGMEKRRGVPDLSDIDPSFRPLLSAMLQPNPKDRPESMAAVASWSTAVGTRTKRPTPRARADAGADVARGSRTGRLAALAAALIVVLGLGGALYAFRDDLAGLLASKTPDHANPPSKGPDAGQTAIALHAGEIGAAYQADLPTFNAPSDAKLRVTAGSAPPEGLRLEDLGAGRSRIVGTPTKVGPAEFQIVATDAQGQSARLQATMAVKPSLAGFLDDFKASPCTLIRARPEASSSFQIFGSDSGEFDRFATAYHDAFGDEAKLVRHKIDDPQCAVLDLLRRAAASSAASPRLELDSDEVGSQKPLAGTADDLAGRHLFLLAIADDGATIGIRYVPTADGSSAHFKKDLVSVDEASVGHTLIVVAIASDQPLKALDAKRFGVAKDFIPKLLADWTDSGDAIDARFATLIR